MMEDLVEDEMLEAGPSRQISDDEVSAIVKRVRVDGNWEERLRIEVQALIDERIVLRDRVSDLGRQVDLLRQKSPSKHRRGAVEEDVQR